MAQHGKAVQAGQQAVERDRVIAAFQSQAQTFLAIGGMSGEEAGLIQRIDDFLGGARFVFDHQDACHDPTVPKRCPQVKLGVGIVFLC